MHFWRESIALSLLILCKALAFLRKTNNLNGIEHRYLGLDNSPTIILFANKTKERWAHRKQVIMMLSCKNSQILWGIFRNMKRILITQKLKYMMAYLQIYLISKWMILRNMVKSKSNRKISRFQLTKSLPSPKHNKTKPLLKGTKKKVKRMISLNVNELEG